MTSTRKLRFYVELAASCALALLFLAVALFA